MVLKSLDEKDGVAEKAAEEQKCRKSFQYFFVIKN